MTFPYYKSMHGVSSCEPIIQGFEWYHGRRKTKRFNIAGTVNGRRQWLRSRGSYSYVVMPWEPTPAQETARAFDDMAAVETMRVCFNWAGSCARFPRTTRFVNRFVVPAALWMMRTYDSRNQYAANCLALVRHAVTLSGETRLWVLTGILVILFIAHYCDLKHFFGFPTTYCHCNP